MPRRTKSDTERFLRLVNEANQAIAAREAQEEKREGLGLDPVRLQRDEERHRNGPLRARAHPGWRPNGVRPVFGHVRVGPYPAE